LERPRDETERSDTALRSHAGAHAFRQRTEVYREAAALLRQIVPGGDRAAKALIELLDLKDTAQYGLIPITRRELTTALRRAKRLLDVADEVLRR
jgi:hypothetical protein